MPQESATSGSVSGLTRMPGLRLNDERGRFGKVMGAEQQIELGFEVRDMFWSRSRLGTVRGMHLQVPPKAGRKLIWVTGGSIRDVVLDLRPSSSTFLNVSEFLIDWESDALLIPPGCAHGFEVLTGNPTVNYAQDCEYDPVCDTGVRWNSFGLTWNTVSPLVSVRDSGLPSVDEFLRHDYFA